MGNWGHKLFEDDFALDIRNEYRDHIGDGLSPSQAVAKLVTREYLQKALAHTTKDLRVHELQLTSDSFGSFRAENS